MPSILVGHSHHGYVRRGNALKPHLMMPELSVCHVLLHALDLMKCSALITSYRLHLDFKYKLLNHKEFNIPTFESLVGYINP